LLSDFDRKKERQEGSGKRKKGKKRQETGRELTVKPLMKPTGLWTLLFMSPLLLDLSPYPPRNNGHCHRDSRFYREATGLNTPFPVVLFFYF